MTMGSDKTQMTERQGMVMYYVHIVQGWPFLGQRIRCSREPPDYFCPSAKPFFAEANFLDALAAL